MLGVSVRSIANWVDRDLLPAGRTPGGHRRIRTEDLRTFLLRQGLPVPDELRDGPQCVLIVDDDAELAAMLAGEIGEAFPECEVHQAHDGFAAGRSAVILKPKVVLMDLRMPGMDGFEACRRITQDPELQPTAVIAMTAWPAADTEREVVRCGASAYLIKPLDFEQVIDLVELALHSDEAVDAIG